MNLLPLFKFRILPSTISKVTPPLLYAQDVTKMLILRCSTNYIVLCIYCGLCYFSPITFCFLLRYLEVGGSSHLNNICLHICCCCCWCTIGFRCLNFNCKSCQNRSSVVHCITITTTIIFMRPRPFVDPNSFCQHQLSTHSWQLMPLNPSHLL